MSMRKSALAAAISVTVLTIAGCGSTHGSSVTVATSPRLSTTVNAPSPTSTSTSTTAAASSPTTASVTSSPPTATTATSSAPSPSSTSTTSAAVPTQHGVAESFASAYVAYLDGRAGSAMLTAATPEAVSQALQGGTVPAKARAGVLKLVTLKSATGIANAFLISARDSAHTFFAQETVEKVSGQWTVTAVMTPDFEQVLVHQVTTPAPTVPGSGAPKATATVFLTGYLTWLYGHGPLSGIHDATGALLANLKANQPNIPPTMIHLHGAVKAIGMQRHAKGWLALVNVHDADSTYQLTLTLGRQKNHWIVQAVSTQ
jgi:hypothetical protein